MEKLQQLIEMCYTVYIEGNPHFNDNQTVAEYMEDESSAFYDCFHEISEVDKAQAIERNTFTTLQVYPNGPGGFLLYMGPDISKMVDLALKEATADIDRYGMFDKTFAWKTALVK